MAKAIIIQKLGRWSTEWEDCYTLPDGADPEEWLAHDRAEEWARYRHYAADYRIKPEQVAA